MDFEATVRINDPLGNNVHETLEAVYPFSAIVGQDRLKRALVLCAVNPEICRVLIRGEKGTGKSTAVRSLAKLLPTINVFRGCPFACDPQTPSQWCENCRNHDARCVESRQVSVFTLPLNATEDRITGGIDFRQAVHEMARVLKPKGALVIAHLMSREELARHHGEHEAVARDVLPDDRQMTSFFWEAMLSRPKILNRPGQYLAKGRKRYAREA